MPQEMTTNLQIALDLRYSKNETDKSRKTVTANFITAVPQTWESNKIYTYVLVLDMVKILNMQPIIVGDPNIIEWDKKEIETELIPNTVQN